MGYGLIYVAHNPLDGEDVFKVGKTSRRIEERMAELSSPTSVLGKYRPIAKFVVFDIDEAERKCHRVLHAHRIQENREFFQLGALELVSLVREAVEQYLVSEVEDFDEYSQTDAAHEGNQVDGLATMLQNARRRALLRAEQRSEKVAASTGRLKSLTSYLHSGVNEVRKEFLGEFLLLWNIPDSPIEYEQGERIDIWVGDLIVRSNVEDAYFQLLHCAEAASPLSRSTYFGLELVPSSSAGGHEDAMYAVVDDGRVGRLSFWIRGPKTAESESDVLCAIELNAIVYRCALMQRARYVEQSILFKDFASGSSALSAVVEFICAYLDSPAENVRTRAVYSTQAQQEYLPKIQDKMPLTSGRWRV